MDDMQMNIIRIQNLSLVGFSSILMKLINFDGGRCIIDRKKCLITINAIMVMDDMRQ